MKTRIIRVNPDSFTDSELAYPAEVIRNGGLAVFPTETVYGIGGDATSPQSARKIYAAKGRPSDNPLIILISRPDEAEKYAVTGPLYCRIAGQFMPGPITVIMDKRDIIPYEVTGGLDTVAVRCPEHPVANALIRLAGVPVAAPSANISGRPSSTSAEYALHDFDGRVECIIDGGESRFGVESTIVKITGDDSLILLRPGAVTADALRCVCGNVEISGAVTKSIGKDEHPICPGMKYRHYAPEKPLTLVGGPDGERLALFREKLADKDTIVICYSEQAAELGTDGVIDIGGRDDLETQGHRIFTALRRCDELPGSRIYANLPPTDGFGLALYNRLIRAAAHTVIYVGKN